MLLVDAEELLLRAIEEKRFIFAYEDTLNQELVMETVYHDLAEFILSAPVIDAEPVQHRRWVKQRGVDTCPECGGVRPFDVQADVIEYWPCNYCPICGAKMDLEGD